MKNIKLFFTILFSISSLMIYGQNCSNYHIDNCRYAGESFSISRQSRSALFTQGMSSKFTITVYSGEEYYISVKGEENLGKIKIRVKEDNKRNTVLYDNSIYNYEAFFYFKNENTKSLIIEITSEAEKKFSSSTNRYCVGVLIEYRTYSSK